MSGVPIRLGLALSREYVNCKTGNPNLPGGCIDRCWWVTKQVLECQYWARGLAIGHTTSRSLLDRLLGLCLEAVLACIRVPYVSYKCVVSCSDTHLHTRASSVKTVGWMCMLFLQQSTVKNHTNKMSQVYSFICDCFLKK